VTDADLLELLKKPNSIETAVVNGNGHLLLGLTDGAVIDVGRVVGPAGATGQRGATGLVGDAGRDGAAVLSGPRAPTEDDGKEGDHWIDISSAEFGFYKRSGNGWSKLANLRQPARDPRVGPIAGGGGSGSNNSGGTLQNTSTLPLSGTGTRKTVDAPGGVIVEEKKGLTNQAGVNNWVQAALMKIDESVPVAVVDALPALGNYEGELIFFDDVLYLWAKGVWVEIGGSKPPTKEMLPWIQISRFKMEESTGTAWGPGYVYGSFWTCNPNATTTWQWEIDVDADGNWIDVADHPQKDDLGFEPNSELNSSLVMVLKDQKKDFPKALFRYRVTGSLNGFESEAISNEVPAWGAFTDTYLPEIPPYYDDGLGNKPEEEEEPDFKFFRHRYKLVNFLDYTGEAGTMGLAVGEADGSMGLDPNCPSDALCAIDYNERDLDGNFVNVFTPTQQEYFICVRDKDTGEEVYYRIDIKEGGSRGPRKAFIYNSWVSKTMGVYIGEGDEAELIIIPISEGIFTNNAEIKKLDGKIDRVESDLTAKIDEIEVGGGKESQPYIDFEQFAVLERSDRFDYDPIYYTNPIASHTWRYEIDLVGNGGFVPVDQLEEGIKTDIGWYGSMSNTHLRLKKTDEQKRLYPDAVMRFVVESDLNSIENTDTTCALPAWAAGECVFNYTRTQFQTRVGDGEEKLGHVFDLAVNVDKAVKEESQSRQSEVSDLQHRLDNLEPYDDSDVREKLEEEKAFRVQGDEANNAAIESLTTQAENLRQADEVEKAARIADDIKISSALAEEARIRGDEDYKLLARINGLEIPEMPGDYDDSGLRELIENESALRITGDAALNAKIDLSEDKINAVDQKVEQEKALRVAGDADLEQKIKLEKEARERGDSDLLARIDELETAEGGVDPETFAADQKRQDDAQGAERAARVENDLKLAKELEDYKEEVKAEQEAQDDVAADHTTRIEALEAVPPGSGAEYLNDLKDVDLNPVRSAAGVLESTFLWLHYMNNPGPGELGINGMNLVINKVSYSPSNDPQELIDKIKPGVTVNLKGVIEGAQQNEDIVVQSIVSRRDTYEIEFATVSAYVRKLFELGHESQGVVLEFSYVDVAVIDPGPGPTPPTPTPPVTSGMFLGYDENKALWVPKTLDVSGGGVTDLSNYYLKTETYSQTEVDDLIKDIDVSVNLDDYYTKAEIDAFENAQDARLDALELNSGSGGGGSVDLSGYYKKSETYSKTEVDDLIADVDVNLDDVYTKSEIDSKNYALTQAYLAGDVALQNQIDDLKGQSPDSAITDLNAKVEINKTAIQHVNEDIKNINDDQKTQNDNIAALEGVVAVGLANRYTKDEVYAKDEVYTKDEVDEKIEAVETNGLVKDAENKVTTDFRIMDSENGDTYISTHDHELGLHNLKEPEMSHHAASKGYADDHDQETLESANTYTDDKLGDYYTKAEVDDSQKEQDDATKELEDAAAILNAQVDQNASDIAVLDATAATNLNDLQDVQLTPPTRSTRELKDRDGGGSEDLLHTNTWETYRAYGVSLEQYQWTLQAGVLQMHETNRVPIEWDDFVAKLLPGNKLHVQIKAGPLRSVTARYEISQGKVDSGVVLIQFTEEPTLLSDFTASARDNDDYQLVVSYSEVTVEPPAEPEEPTKRSDIILGYDADTKLWTPHKADYLPLDGGTVKSAINFRAGDKDYDQFSISPNGQNDYATNFYQRNGAQFRIRTTPDKNANQNYKTHFVVGQPQGGKPETKISWLVEPTSSHHAANKEYVDKQVYTPPGLKFTYQSNISSVDEGKFAYDDSNKRLRLSTKSHHVDFSNTLVEDVNQSGLTWTFTIWHQDANGKWYIRVTGKLHRIDFHSDDLLCYVDLHYKHSSFAVDASYWITIAGLF
jgi:hypothetical protein